MERKISFDLRFRKDNKDAVSFSEYFSEDLGRCMARFRISLVSEAVKNPEADSYIAFVLASADLNDQKFLASIISSASMDHVLILNIDPLRNVGKEFPIHKFRVRKFWDEIRETSEVRFFRRKSGENNALYWEMLTDIAVEIDTRNSHGNELKKGKVFLGQTDDYQAYDRENLLRDLTEMGYRVVPDRMLGTDYEECSNQIHAMLKDCNLIIHPIPLVYTRYFSGKQVSLVEHQFNISAEYCSKHAGDVPRIIWIPSDFEITDEENQIFVEKIQRDQDQTGNTTVLKLTLEELKKVYRKVLAGDKAVEAEKGLPDVYLIADRDDEKTGEKLIASHSAKGLSISKNYKGITYNQHLSYLANSEFVIINYSTENEPWFTMKVNDIFKSKGIQASKPFKKLILIKEKKDLDTTSFDNRFSEVHVSSMDEFKLDLSVNTNK